MEQQQINYEINPPLMSTSSINQQQFNQVNQNNPSNAHKRVKQLSKNFYTNFPPYQSYFNAKSTHITLHKNKPKFHLHSNLYDRQRLTLQRQSMYYRGAVDEYITDDFLKSYIEQSSIQTDFVNKKGNKSIIHSGVFYYAYEQSIKAIQLPKMKNQSSLQLHQQSVQPLQIVKFQKGNIILEIKSVQNHVLNTIYQGLIIIVRFGRKIIIFSVKDRKVIETLESHTQFTQISYSVYRKHCLQTIEYDGVSSTLSTYQIQPKNHKLSIKNQDSINVQNLFNSKIDLSRNQILLTKHDGLYSLDRRSGKEVKVYQVKNLNKQRFYNSIPLKGLFNYSSLIASCQSRYISIFDIRKPNSMIKTYLHQCEQAPPEIMNFYDGTSSTQLFQPILTCNSPYPLGSSVVMPLNLDTFQDLNTEQRNQFEFYKNNIPSHFTLLFDYGKSSRESSLHHLYNESVSLWNSSFDQFLVIKVDSQGSVDMEIFKYNQVSDKYQRRELHIENQSILQSHKKPNPSEVWLEQKLKDKYFLKQTIYEQFQQQLPTEQIKVKSKRKGAKKKKTKNTSKAQKKMSQLKQLQTQVDVQDFLEGEYQNSQECENSLVKRKVNYADLSQFYYTLQQKATLSKVQVQKKHNQLEFSLNSTQPNSEGYLFSQSLGDDSGTKALSFHNKKLMNFSILQKLKNEWDN